MNQTLICKICFNSIKTNTGYYLLHHNTCLCEKCQSELKPHFNGFISDNIKCISIYKYDDKIKSLLYQLKGCYDIEIASIFLDRFKRELSLRFHGYVVIPVPSDKESNNARGFNHVQEIFKSLKLKMIPAIQKTMKHKQSDMKKEERKNVIKYFKWDNSFDINNKKILIVDDVYTTGSTINAIISLVKEHNPKTIRVLVLSKVEEHTN